MNRTIFALALAACFLVGACDNYKGKLTTDSFEKIQAKMSRNEVEALLGPGEVLPPDPGSPVGFFDKGRMVKITIMGWTDGERRMTVTFFDDEVASANGSAMKKRTGF